MIGLVSTTGKEHVPSDGPVLLVANHAYRVLDPVVLSLAVPRKCKFVAHTDILNSFFLGSFIPKDMIIPIEDSLKAIHESVDLSKKALNEGFAVVFFPEGRKMGNGHGEYRTGAAYVAAQAQCPIIPVRIQRTVFFRHRVIFGSPVAPPPTRDRITLKAHTQVLKEQILAL